MAHSGEDPVSYSGAGRQPGVWAGMYLFRHKTKHVSFVLGIPLILIVQTALLIFMRLR